MTKNARGEPCYIVYYFVRYQDGSEEGVALFNDLNKAHKYIEEELNGMNGHNKLYRIFELGKEIPFMVEKEVVQPPPPPPVERFVVRSENHSVVVHRV